MANSEESSMFDIETLGIKATLRDDGKFIVDVAVLRVGDKHAYATRYKVDRSLLDVNGNTLDLFFDEAKRVLRETLEGKRELNAII